MVVKLQALLGKCGTRKKMFSYVKDEGTNLGAITTTLKVVVNCESLGLEALSKIHVLGMPC
jgi:hypothetical protein